VDDVVARSTDLLTSNRHWRDLGAGVGRPQAVINTVTQPHDRIAVCGGDAFVARTNELLRRYGAEPVSTDDRGSAAYVVVPLIDPFTAQRMPVETLALGGRVIVEATLGLGACDLRVDDWNIDVCVAGLDYALGRTIGMSLVTYSEDVHRGSAAPHQLPGLGNAGPGAPNSNHLRRDEPGVRGTQALRLDPRGRPLGTLGVTPNRAAHAQGSQKSRTSMAIFRIHRHECRRRRALGAAATATSGNSRYARRKRAWRIGARHARPDAVNHVLARWTGAG
jgi:hypothetical protein